MTAPAPDTRTLRERLTSKQFIVTLIGMGLVFWATMHGKEVMHLAGVVVVAITGAAGVNWKERS